MERRTHDYGIDFGVEIFRNGAGTGLHFGVQLKATEKVGRRPTIRLKRSSANYWSSLDYPVLIVLFDASSKTLWWQWWHRHDPYGADATAARFTFAFPIDQRLSLSAAEDLEAEVVAYRCWPNAAALLPLSVVIRGSGMLGATPAGAVIIGLRRRLAPFVTLVEPRSVPAGPLFFSVDVGTDQTVVWVSGGPSATLHYESPSGRDLPSVDIAGALSADVVLILAGRMALLPGLTADAARIAASAIDESLTVLSPELLPRTMELLLGGGRVDDALRLAVLARADERAAMEAHLMLMSFARSADEASRNAIADGLGSWAAEAEAAGNLLEAARWSYNKAQVIRSDNLEDALTLLLSADELDPGYRTRTYWWREQGGLLFLLSRYEEAADAYRHAVDLGDRSVLPLLADALLWSGRTVEAIELFAQVALDRSLTEPEWRLKALVFKDLLERAFDDQVLLDADALHGAAHDESTPEEVRSALAVAAALVGVDVPHLWLDAMAFTLGGDLFEDVAVTGRRFCGSAIVDLLLESDLDTASALGLQAFFERLPPGPPAPNVLRLIDPTTGEVTIIDL